MCCPSATVFFSGVVLSEDVRWWISFALILIVPLVAKACLVPIIALDKDGMSYDGKSPSFFCAGLKTGKMGVNIIKPSISTPANFIL